MLVLQASRLVFLEAQGSDSELAQCFLLLKCCCPLIFFPQAWQTALPPVEDRCEVSFKAINPANLLKGRLLSARHCFTFPALLPSEPCMALQWLPFKVCLGKQQNKTEQYAMVGGVLFVKKKKKRERDKCFFSSAYSTVIVFFLSQNISTFIW